MNLFPFIPGYSEFIYGEGREPAFVMLVAFLVAFIAARSYTRIARVRGWKSASFGGVHTHHLVFGVVLALVSAAIEFSVEPSEGLVRLGLAATFGVGAALILDEFALLFHLQDVYWEREGRKSVDAVVIAAILGFLFLLHATPFGGSTGDEVPRVIITTVQVLNMIFVIIAALKGKIFIAGLGVFVPLLAIIGALRLAEPGSIWFKMLYRKHSRQAKRAIKRYKQYDKKWRPRKERLWDLIGGGVGRPVR